MILRIAFKILYFFGWYRALAWTWMPSLSYLFCHLMMLTFGIWVVIQPSSHDANQMVKNLVPIASFNDHHHLPPLPWATWIKAGS